MVRQAQKDPRLFGKVYDLYVHRVYRFLYSQGLSSVEADDVVAQTFLDALESLPRYREQGRFAGWLFSIARNRMRDHFRAVSRERTLDEMAEPREHTSMPERIDQQRMVEALGGLIDGLEPAQRELLHLRYAADLTFREIAHVVEDNEEAVKKRLYRLVASLREQMEIEHV
jgi:RNA polymerase sigma-70 factor (ECF subfamily)